MSLAEVGIDRATRWVYTEIVTEKVALKDTLNKSDRKK